MANYEGYARSNHFKVKDPVVFKEWLDTLNTVSVWEEENNGVTTFAIYDSGDSGCWPSCVTDFETYEDTDIDFIGELSGHLVPGEVAVLVDAGHEKLRYIGGAAIAVNHLGETVSVSLHDIYKLAFDKFGVLPNPAEY